MQSVLPLKALLRRSLIDLIFLLPGCLLLSFLFRHGAPKPAALFYFWPILISIIVVMAAYFIINKVGKGTMVPSIYFVSGLLISVAITALFKILSENDLMNGLLPIFISLLASASFVYGVYRLVLRANGKARNWIGFIVWYILIFFLVGNMLIARHNLLEPPCIPPHARYFTGTAPDSTLNTFLACLIFLRQFVRQNVYRLVINGSTIEER